MKDFSLYLPEEPTPEIWGGSATACGKIHVGPGTPYPPRPGEHPCDHLFRLPDGGRILNAYQLLYISAGAGSFESAATGKVRVEAGTAFLLFPSVWHRYMPDPSMGWTEYFLELRGPVLDQLVQQGRLCPEHPSFDLPDIPGFLGEFQKLLHYALDGGTLNRDLMTTLGMHLLSQVIQSSRNPQPTPESRAVREAELRIREDLSACPDLERLALELGINYDRFRRQFKQLTGLAPKQYHRKLQMRRAEELLLNTQRTIGSIAEELGFSSAFHLSAAFKEHAGQSPVYWRDERRQPR